jgi:hypothetical protein
MASFFPPDPYGDDGQGFSTPPMDPWWRPPEDELPVLVPLAERIAVTPQVALVLTSARVFREGVEFRVDRRHRRGDLSERDWQLAQWDFHGPWARRETGRLRYGVALGDGSKALLDEPGPGFGLERPTGYSLRQSDSSGSGSEAFYLTNDGLWLWPLPPEGPLELVAEWPAQGIPETRVVLDGGALRAVAAGVTRVWD